MNHTQIGDITEYEFFLFCMKNDIPVSKPLTNNLPYDCIIDLKGKLLKIQIKTGYSGTSNQSFIFNTKTTSKNFSEIKEKNYNGLIDGFITAYKELPNKFFYIPVEKASSSSMAMYYGDRPTKSQNWVKDFDFENLIPRD